MFFCKNKNIIIQEYSRKSDETNGTLVPINRQSKLSFSGSKMAIALARTLCSNHLDQKEYYFDVIISMFSLSLIIHKPMNNFRLKSSRVNRLRDFSRTNKIGELGQATVWLYLMENGYPYINDFDFFCKQNGIDIPANSSTPDFVAQKEDKSVNLCLAESKGKLTNSTTRTKTNLKIGISQCNCGEALINSKAHTPFQIVKKIAFSAEFSNENDNKDSQLSFADPENFNDNLNKDDLPLRIHFASWFYIIADFENAESLIKGNPIKFNEDRFQKSNVNGIDFWTINIFDILIEIIHKQFIKDFEYFLPLFIFRYRNIKLGISHNVIKYLKNSNNAENLETLNSVSENNYEIFVDGTIIVGIPNYEKKS